MTAHTEKITLPLARIAKDLVRRQDAEYVRDYVLAVFKTGSLAVLDFEGVGVVSSDFLCCAIGELYGQYPREFIQANLSIENADAWKLETINDVVENSIDYYAKKSTDSRDSTFAERLREAVEHPSDDLIRRIAEAVVEHRLNGVLSGQKAVKVEPSRQTLNDVRFALAALADAVR